MSLRLLCNSLVLSFSRSLDLTQFNACFQRSFFCYYPTLRRKAEALRAEGNHVAALAFMEQCEDSLRTNTTAVLLENSNSGGSSTNTAIDLSLAGEEEEEEEEDVTKWLWQVNVGNGGWIDMEQQDSETIERAYRSRTKAGKGAVAEGGASSSSKKSKDTAHSWFTYVSVRAGNETYAVDLAGMRQRSTFGTVRPIRRSLR